MEQQSLFKGRDKRKKGWFWMDNDYLNGYAKYFGAVGTAIYVSLCRHADNETQKCFPAQELIAEELGTAVRTVRKYLALFQQHKIISIQREKDPITKRWINNVYTLLDKECWEKPQATDAPGAIGKQQPKPEATDDKAIGTFSPNKETHINKTHIKDIETQSVSGKEVNNLMELFKPINPSYERLFSNMSQRKVVGRLLEKHGAEKLGKLLAVLPQTNTMQYAPVITTPFQLEEKLGAIIIFIAKEKIKVENKKPNIVKIS